MFSNSFSKLLQNTGKWARFPKKFLENDSYFKKTFSVETNRELHKMHPECSLDISFVNISLPAVANTSLKKTIFVLVFSAREEIFWKLRIYA